MNDPEPNKLETIFGIIVLAVLTLALLLAFVVKG